MNPRDDLLALATQAKGLADAISVAQNRLGASADEPTRRVGYRLDDVIGRLRQAHDDLAATAEDLARIKQRGTCPADWGACPDHGATLRSHGGRSWCPVSGCGRAWDYDRAGLPCSEDATHLVSGPADDTPGPMCAGHARAAATVPGFRVEAVA